MMFGLFRDKKEKSIQDFLVDFALYREVIGRIEKAKSLRRLNRVNECNQALLEAESIARTYIDRNSREKRAHLLLALFLIETGDSERAIPLIDNLLNSSKFQWSSDEKQALLGALQKFQRERPYNERTPSATHGFTQVYCCTNCGRLHNFVSLPCPHCDWFPTTIEEMARSMSLTNLHFKIPALLLMSREMAKGRKVDHIVPNLVSTVQIFLNTPQRLEEAKEILALAHTNANKNHRLIGELRECGSCSARNPLSGGAANVCVKCDQVLNWPDALRALACMDNLLWFFEQRVEVSSEESFSDFVCILVAMLNNLLRKQESPSSREREYSIRLLSSMAAVCDADKGAVIHTKNPQKLEIFMFKENMRDDSETFGMLICMELKYFVEVMERGVLC